MVTNEDGYTVWDEGWRDDPNWKAEEAEEAEEDCKEKKRKSEEESEDDEGPSIAELRAKRKQKKPKIPKEKNGAKQSTAKKEEEAPVKKQISQQKNLFSFFQKK